MVHTVKLHWQCLLFCSQAGVCWLCLLIAIMSSMATTFCPYAAGVESWSVINSQDAVARSGKLMGMFKRAGERVFLNQCGDMLVCPIFLEAALWRKLGPTNVRHHLLAAYLKVQVQQLSGHCLLVTDLVCKAKVRVQQLSGHCLLVTARACKAKVPLWA